MLKKILNAVMDFFSEKKEGISCPECYGNGTVLIHKRPDRKPDPLDTRVACPTCRGTGYVPEYVRKKDEL